MIRSLALTAGLALVVSGCGGGDESGDPGTGVTVRVAERATGGYAFIEGYLSFVELSRAGTVVADGELTDGTADLEVAPGVYRLRFYLRPCSGNCSNLDPPTDECVRPLDLSRAGRYAVVIRHGLGPGAGCQVTTRRTADPAS